MSINIDVEVTVDGQTQTILNNTSGTLVFTINNTGLTSIVLKTIDPTDRPNAFNWNPSYTFSCTVSSGGSSSSDSASTASAQQAVDKDAGQAQLDVVSTNIGVRIANIGSPAGISRNSPSGVGRSIPGGGGNPVNDQPSNLSNFAGFGDSTGYKSQGAASIRDLLMRASFDTSDMSYGVAGDDSGPDAPDILRARSDLSTDRPLTVWGYGSFTSIENDRNNNAGDLRYDGDVWGYNLGFDYAVMPDAYVGVSFGYSETDLTTTFNSGTYDEKNFSATPYAVFNLSQNFKISVLGGYSFGDQDRERDANVTSSTDTNMWFAATSASYRFRPNEEIPLDITANASLLGSRKTTDAYTESEGTVVDKSTSTGLQVKPGFEASYLFDHSGTVIQPFAKVDFVYDLRDTTNDDSNAFDVGGGVRFGNASRGFAGSFEGQTQVERDDYSEYSLGGLISYGIRVDSIFSSGEASLSPYVKSNYVEESQTITTGIDYADSGATLSVALARTLASESNVGSSVLSLQARLEF
ncbi:MAG: autotransporter outer membrane beta-barrel domain-containing protein [Rhodospirillales bacterium]|nr:autotransporter outer membrane beta-barrel domain-containing protein [Rhodospirillales bacterium]